MFIVHRKDELDSLSRGKEVFKDYDGRILDEEKGLKSLDEKE